MFQLLLVQERGAAHAERVPWAPWDRADFRSIRTAVLSLSCTGESSGEFFKQQCLHPAPSNCELIGLGWNLGMQAFESFPGDKCSG